MIYAQTFLNMYIKLLSKKFKKENPKMFKKFQKE